MTILLAIIFSGLTAIAAAYVIDRSRRERERQELFGTVEATSHKLKSLLDYNKAWPFCDFPIELTYRVPFSSRAEAKKANAEDLLATMIHVHYEEIMDAIRKINVQKARYQLYSDGVKSNSFYTPDSVIEETGADISEYRKKEDVLYKEHIQKPDICLIITIKKAYTNKEQRNCSILRHFKGEEIDEFIRKEWLNRVLYFSERIAKLQGVNKAHQELFVDIKPRHVFQKRCSSYNEFKKYEESDLLMIEVLQESAEMFQKDFDGIKTNTKYYKQYLKMIASIAPTSAQSIRASGVPEQVFSTIEQETFQKMRLPAPTMSFSRGVRVLYFSQKRNNRHGFNREYSSDRLLELIGEQERAKEYRAQRNDERSKMTNSLRYDILRRDGFRCVLCGASASDGVKLHVDHIIPVSKGGRTVTSNLRTLCDRCNTGKRDKYDPTGLN